MEKELSFYQTWYNKCRFKRDINEILFSNFVKAIGDGDNSLITKFISYLFYMNKWHYYNNRFKRKIKQLSKAYNVSPDIIRTHLLFEIKRISLYPGSVNDAANETPRNPVRLLDLNILKYCKNLEIIEFYGQDIFNLTPLSYFPRLKELTLVSDITHPGSEQELSGVMTINRLQQLKYLNLSGNFISNFKEITNPRIEYLELRETNLKSIADLSSLTNLKFLEIAKTKINNLQGIEVFMNLEVLCLYNNGINDYSPILNLPKLKLVTYHEYDEQKMAKAKSELLKLKEQKRNFSFKDEYSFNLRLFRELHGSIEEGLQYRLNEILGDRTLSDRILN